MTPDLFTQWKKKKVEEREAGLATKRAERAKVNHVEKQPLHILITSINDGKTISNVNDAHKTCPSLS